MRPPVPNPPVDPATWGAGGELGDGPRLLRIVLVEDDEADAALMVAALEGAGLELEVTRVGNEAELRHALVHCESIDAVLCDYSLPEMDALRALEMRSDCGVNAPLVVVSGGLSDEQAAECMRLGAVDYVHKDRLARLPYAIVTAVQHARSELARRESAESYIRLFETVPLAVFRATAEGRIIDANPAAVAMFGYADLDSLLEITVPDLHVDPSDRQLLLHQLETEGHVLAFECRMRRADGSEFWLSRAVQSVRQVDGRVVELESIGSDATERLDATRRLRDSEAYLSTVIETAPDAVVRMDQAGMITDWNSEARKIFGWKPREVIGKRLSETIIPPDLREQHEKGVARFRKDGTSTMIGKRWDTYSAIRKGGERFPIEMSISPPIPLGDSSQFVGFVRDISERKHAELELATSEERLRSLLMGLPIAIVTVDVEGRFTFAGGSVFTAMGTDPGALIGLSHKDAFADRPEFGAILAAALEGEIQADLEFPPHTYHVRCGPFRLHPEGPVIGACAVAFDNSDRVDADRALRQSEEYFRVLFEQAAVGITLLEVTAEGVVSGITRNQRMLEMLGLQPGSDTSWWESPLGPGERGATEAEYRRLMAGETEQVDERRQLIRPDDSSIWVDISTVLVRDSNHQALRLQAMALDVTERVNAEARLIRRAAQQTALLDLSRLGLAGGETAGFLAAAIEIVTHGTETQFGTILELHPADGTFVRAAVSGDLGPEAPGPASADIVRQVMDALKTDKQVLVFDWEGHPELARSPWMARQGVVVSLLVGIGEPQRPYGVLAAHSDVPRKFTPDDLQFLQLASTIIWVALERKRSEQERRLLLSRVVTAQEAERKAIAEDIHDDAVQVMTAANLRLELFRMAITDPVQMAAAEKLQEAVTLATGRLRNLLFELIPPALERHGIAAALRMQLERVATDTGLKWHIDNRLLEEPGQDERILLYRIFQEAVVNIRKHARATKITVSMSSLDGGVEMLVADDGVGFADPGLLEPELGHLGLASMRERAEIAGGRWHITSEPGHGTQVSTWVPAHTGPSAPATPEVMALG